MNLDKLFKPESVAIIGASSNEEGTNGLPFKYLIEHNYTGEIFLVNPKYKSIRGITCYASLDEIDEEIDVALIMVNATQTLSVIKQCINKKVKFAVIFGAGYREAGIEGTILEDKLSELVRNSDLRVVGPNCIGLLNLESSIPLGFAYPFSIKDYISGSVALCSQSGAYGIGLWTRLHEENIGVKFLATTGNEINLSVADFINYYTQNPDIKVIGVYVEGFSNEKDSQEFVSALERATKKGKKVVILKAGSSESGKKAAESHTAALAGSFDIFEAICKQQGAYVVTNISDQINLIKLLNAKKQLNGERIGIITTSGALGILMADDYSGFGLQVPQLSEEITGSLKLILPSYSSIVNPIDITAQVMNNPNMLEETLQLLGNSDEIDIIVVLSSTISGSAAEAFKKAVIETDRKINKPIITCLIGGEMISKKISEPIQKENIPYFRSPYDVAKTINETIKGKLLEENTSILINKNLEGLDIPIYTNWTEYNAKEWLRKEGFTVPHSVLVASPQELQNVEEFLTRKSYIKFPLVIKGQSHLAKHKSDLGLIKTGIKDLQDLKINLKLIWQKMNNLFDSKDIEGILIEEQVPPGIEVIVSVKKDSIYGSVLMFGAGGIFVELTKDIQFHSIPMSIEQSRKIIENSKIYPLLKGARTKIEYDIDSLAQFLNKFSIFAWQTRDDISEIELNPVYVLPEEKGVVVVDALISHHNKKSPVNNS